ncbi:MAG: MFS transporter [Bacteroidales bacterium]|nr:MFS transporter [Bacteroidales bacterium]MBO7584712.1 MFS transporter [Bacteroidales bacterium]MBP5316299.1 MFS transporter [Bacteroidales bacterium]
MSNTTTTNKNGRLVAIITMCFIFAMISFVTNMAAPFGNIWKGQYSWAAMMGNMMNFAAYLFMGIPAGKMLVKVGYKKTTLIALATGFVGICIQYLSSFGFLGESAIYVYLLGAFVCGFCVCMLNTVVNPMLNILGGGGNRGNQLIQTGGTLNSLTGTLTPLLVGVLIGTVTDNTAMSDVVPLLFIAMGVFALAFIIISFVNIPEPAKERKTTSYEHSAWSFRHTVLGVIAIFFYVGIEIGIPAQLNFYISDLGFEGSAAVAGFLAASYWFLMMIGRFLSSTISGKISTRTQMISVSSLAILLLLIAIFLPESVSMTVKGSAVPMKCIFLALCGICTSIMWGAIFNLAVEGLGKYTEQASGIFMMMVVGGGIMPLIQQAIAQRAGAIPSYWLVVAMLAYLLYYAIWGSKNVNKDIPVE